MVSVMDTSVGLCVGGGTHSRPLGILAVEGSQLSFSLGTAPGLREQPYQRLHLFLENKIQLLTG